MNMTEKVHLDDSVLNRIQQSVTIDSATLCWNWNKRLDQYGYGKISVRRKVPHLTGNKKWSSETTIRVVYTLYKGDIPDGYVVRHTCNNRRCVNPDHLVVGTIKDNASDMVKANRQCKGTNQHLSVLNEEQVREIRKLLPLYSNRKIAHMYGCNDGTIWFIRKGITWKHVV